MIKRLIAWLKKLFGMRDEAVVVKPNPVVVQVDVSKIAKAQAVPAGYTFEDKYGPIVDSPIRKLVNSHDNYIGFTSADMANLDIVFVDEKGNEVTAEQKAALQGKGYVPEYFLARKTDRGL